MLRLARILGQDKTAPTPLPTYKGVGNKPGDGIPSKGAERNTLPYTSVLDHPNPVTKVHGKVDKLPIHPQIYQLPRQLPSTKQHTTKSQIQEPV